MSAEPKAARYHINNPAILSIEARVVIKNRTGHKILDLINVHDRLKRITARCQQMQDPTYGIDVTADRAGTLWCHVGTITARYLTDVESEVAKDSLPEVDEHGLAIICYPNICRPQIAVNDLPAVNRIKGFRKQTSPIEKLVS